MIARKKLLVISLAHLLSGCSDSETEKIDKDAPVVKIESHEDYKEVKVVGRSYSLDLR